jgi:hypothetical protein
MLLSCSSDPDPEKVSTAPQKPGLNYATEQTTQSETSVVTATAFLFPTVVVGFIDFSFAQASPTPEFTYLPSVDSPEDRITRRGASLAGWSVSLDAGASFQYRGKLRPPAGWAFIRADPSLATDPRPGKGNRVYYVSLASSNESWDAATGGSDEALTDELPDSSDGFCVGRSLDGGQTFPDVACSNALVPGAAGPVFGADRTALAVDGDGLVYVANIDYSNLGLAPVRVWRSASPEDWGSFSLISTDNEGLQFGSQDPVLLTDALGDVVMAARKNLGVLFSRFDRASLTWDVPKSTLSLCDVPVRADPIVLTSGKTLKNGHSFHVAAGRGENGAAQLRFALQVARPTGGVAIQLAVVEGDSCLAPRAWSTLGDDGVQFQPTVSFANRGGTPNWWVSYLTTAGVVDPAQDQVRVETARAVMDGDAFGLAYRTYLTPTDWRVCTNDTGFWGDYFGATQIRDTAGAWWGVAAFSDSRGGPCKNGGFGGPLHVAAQRW